MGSIFRPPFMPAYFELARIYNVPIMVPRFSEERLAEWGMSEQEISKVMRLLADLDAAGMPLMDQLHQMPLRKPRRRMGPYQKDSQKPAAGSDLFHHPSGHQNG